MSKSLLFLPDISGFTDFVQNTEAKHSQHVIAELLEVLIEANTLNLELAEVEGDALFFFKENEIPSLERILAQVETMFTAFYSHLKLLEKNRICPCNACSTASNLGLKIIAHSGNLEYITVQNKRKPFGNEVIESHRLMKNTVDSDNYVLLSKDLAKDIQLTENYQSKLFNFKSGSDRYDEQNVEYFYSIIEKKEINLSPFSQAKEVSFEACPTFHFKKNFPIDAPRLLEHITNYSQRHLWVKGVDKFEYNTNEVTRLGTEHVCVVNGKLLNFTAVTKKGKPGQLIYGELTNSIPVADNIYQFYIITPLSENACQVDIEVYIEVQSILKKLLLFLFVKKTFRKNLLEASESLLRFVQSQK